MQPGKYVNVKRLLDFLERSIDAGTQWVVFEPNDEALWERVKDTIRLFLRTQWRAGRLQGQAEEDAFFIICDRSTMTQDDILNGRLICEIGVAPLRPAEFVIIRLFQPPPRRMRIRTSRCLVDFDAIGSGSPSREKQDTPRKSLDKKNAASPHGLGKRARLHRRGMFNETGHFLRMCR